MMFKKVIALISLPIILTGCGYSHSGDLNSYSELLQSCIDNPDFATDLYIFPKSTSIGKPTNFIYKKMDDLFNGSYFIYLVMEYDETSFNEELSRIDKIEGHFTDLGIKKIIHFEQNSCYLTISRDSRYEYVRYNKDTFEIAYVSNQLFSWSTARVDIKHSLPPLTIPPELDDGDNSYNMYYFYRDEPDGLGGTIHVGIYVDQ